MYGLASSSSQGVGSSVSISSRGRDSVATLSGPSLNMMPGLPARTASDPSADQFDERLVSFTDDHDVDVFVADGLLRHGRGMRPSPYDRHLAACQAADGLGQLERVADLRSRHCGDSHADKSLDMLSLSMLPVIGVVR